MFATKRNLSHFLLLIAVVTLGLLALPTRSTEAKRNALRSAVSISNSSPASPGIAERLNGARPNAAIASLARDTRPLYKSLFPQLSGSPLVLSNIVATRIVRVVPTTLQANSAGTVAIELDAQGDENALGFSLTFDQTKLTYVSAVKGVDANNAGATMNINSSAVASGRLGIALGLPAGAQLPAGTRQMVVVTFNVPASSNGSTNIGFGDSPIFREIVDVNAFELSAQYDAGAISITPVSSPVPTLTSLSPTSALAGGAGFSLTVNGSGFVGNSVVRFNGSDRVTSFVSSTQLTAQITAADIQSSGSFPVTVFTPAPGGGTSSSINLAVNNPVPAVASLSPSSAVAGGTNFVLTVNGSGFVNGAQVLYNGSSRTTTFVSSSQLTAQITAADISTAGSANVSVSNPAPGGGVSNTLSFSITTNPAFRILRVVGGTINAGQNNFVNVELDSQGDENALGFSLNFDPAKLTFISAVKGSGVPNATINVNPSSAASGRVGIAVANPAGQNLPAGTRQIAVLTFNVPDNGNGSTDVTFGDSPVAREIVDVNAVSLSATYNSGTLNITPLPSPVPAITSLNPASVIVGGPAFTLTLNGSGFVSSSVARYNGADRATTFISSSQLAIEMSAADIQSTGSFPVTVFNPAPGGGTSNAINLAVNNPTPTLTSISPTSTVAGSPAFTLTVNGSGFIASSTVAVNGSSRTTTFVSASQLTAQVTAADISTAGTRSITVVNPTPGGGTSNSQNFNINTNPAFRFVRIVGATINAGQNNGITIELDAQGDENALGFSLNFDPTKLTYVSAAKGTGAPNATLNVNSSSAASGRVGLAIANPTNETFAAGTRQIVVVTFNVPDNGGGTTDITFGDNPVPRETVNVNAADLGTSYTPGSFTITPLPRPVPALTSISPNSTIVGSAGFTLTLNGSGFVNSSIARFNGSDRATTFVSSAQLAIEVSAADIASAGLFPITVFNPAPGGGTSNAIDLAVNNPTPTLSSLSPTSAVAGTGPFTLTVNGTNFKNGSVVRINGSNRTTSFVGSSVLTAQITAADINTAGTAVITVFTPTPGGGVSNGLNFTINTNPAFRILRVVTSTVEAGQNITVPVDIDSQGDENALGFSLSFDPTKLTYVSTVRGDGAPEATLNVNTAGAATGHLGFALGNPAGEALQAGTRRLLVVTFSVPLPVSGPTNISFSDSPIGREIVNTNAALLAATYSSGTLDINHPAPILTSVVPAALIPGPQGPPCHSMGASS